MTNDNKGNGGGNEGHGHQIKIIVNGREKTVRDKHLTFEQVVALAFETPPSATTVFTVTYRRADQKPDSGTLAPGKSVKVKDGTTFNVTATDRS